MTYAIMLASLAFFVIAMGFSLSRILERPERAPARREPTLNGGRFHGVSR